MMMIVIMIMSMIVLVLVVVMVAILMAMEMVMVARPMMMMVARMLVVVVVVMAFAGQVVQRESLLFMSGLPFANQSDGDRLRWLVATTGATHVGLVLRLRNSPLG